MTRLDTRPVLHGEPRLSNAQVRALRAASPTGRLGDARAATWLRLEEMHLVRLAGDARAIITGRGQRILNRIDGINHVCRDGHLSTPAPAGGKRSPFAARVECPHLDDAGLGDRAACRKFRQREEAE